MNSCVCSWVNGIKQWSVFHDADRGVEHLEVAGVPPEQLKVIQDQQYSQQADLEDADHIFDVPIELFAALGGLRYDQDIPGAGPTPWQVLARVPRAAETKKWWWPFA
jgi:hypothetical protein